MGNDPANSTSSMQLFVSGICYAAFMDQRDLWRVLSKSFGNGFAITVARAPGWEPLARGEVPRSDLADNTSPYVTPPIFKTPRGEMILFCHDGPGGDRWIPKKLVRFFRWILLRPFAGEDISGCHIVGSLQHPRHPVGLLIARDSKGWYGNGPAPLTAVLYDLRRMKIHGRPLPLDFLEPQVLSMVQCLSSTDDEFVIAGKCALWGISALHLSDSGSPQVVWKAPYHEDSRPMVMKSTALAGLSLGGRRHIFFISDAISNGAATENPRIVVI